MPSFYGSGTSPANAVTSDVTDAISARQDAMQAQIDAINAFTIVDADPSGSTLARGAIAVWTGADWVGVPSGTWTNTTNRDTWVAGSGGASPITLLSATVPPGTNGTAYTATILATGGVVDSASKYKTVTTSTGSLPGWASYTLIAGGITITGTAATGTTNLTVRITDWDLYTLDIPITLSIVASGGALNFAWPATLPPAYVGSNYTLDIAPFVTGGTTPYIFDRGTSPDLPNHGIDFDGAHSIHNTRVLTNADQSTFPAQIRVTDSAGTPATSTKTGNLTISPATGPSTDVAQWISTDYNSATGVGHYQGTSTFVVPSAVVAALNAIPAGTRIYSSVAGTLAIGTPASATSFGKLIKTSAIWDLDGSTAGTQAVTILLAPNQPVNAPSTDQTAMLFYMSGVTSPVLKFTLDGNRANQITSTPANPAGCYYHGVRLQTCGGAGTGATTGTLIIKNIRGVVGGNTTNYNGTGKSAAEVFAYQDLRGSGADSITMSLLCDDGGDKTNTASGMVYQYRAIGAPAWTVALLQADKQRHAFGTYCGGTGTLAIGTSGITNCHFGVNIEAGKPVGSAVHTGTITVAPLFPLTSFPMTNNGTAGAASGDFIINCNNTAGTAAQQIDGVAVTGAHSTGCVNHHMLSGASGHPTSVSFTDSQVISPINAGTNFGNAANQAGDATALVLTACLIRLTVAGSADVKGGNLAAGQGVWTPF